MKEPSHNKLYILIVLIVLTLGVLYVGYSRGNKISKNQSTETLAVNSHVEDLTPSIYVPYSEEVIEQAFAEGKKVVLFFYAEWCPSCRVADAEINQNYAEFPHNFVLVQVDYDTATELKKKYGVTYQHTFVQIDEAGNELVKWNGGGVKEILKHIK